MIVCGNALILTSSLRLRPWLWATLSTSTFTDTISASILGTITAPSLIPSIINGGYKPGFLWCRDGAMKLRRCRDGVFYWCRDGAMKLIRCRDGVFYWRRDGAKNKTAMGVCFIQGQTCFVGFGTSLSLTNQYSMDSFRWGPRL